MKDCNSCGKCCIKYGGGDLAVTQADIDRWADDQPHIYQYVKDNAIWFDPDTGQRLSRCPFLQALPQACHNRPVRYTCTIYSDRPEDCRLYPSLIDEMVRDGCEMIEPADLKNNSKAQESLDIIMYDSRFS